MGSSFYHCTVVILRTHFLLVQMEEAYWNPVAVLEDIYHQMYKKRQQEIPRALITIHNQMSQEGQFSSEAGASQLAVA